MTSPIALITVSYFSGDDVANCLRSVAAASAEPPQLIVVNNAATDDLQPVLAPFPTATVLNPGSNLGYGAAVNLAAGSLPVSAEWILVTNPDVEFTPGSIDALLAVATADDRIGVVGPRITNDDGTIYPSARALPSFTAGAGHAIFHRVWPGNPWSRRYLQADRSQTRSDRPVTSGWLSGACLLVRRTAFEEVGGFDDRFFMYFEDVDLGERLANAGWKVLYVPTASVAHAGGTSTKAHSAAMTRAHHHSAYLYLAKRYHQWYYLPVRVALRVGLGLRSAAAGR
ncbi:glycosyltransferase family 2 protein [Subtercola endophyticus]|uniref:glycosyltransferase family 2 protein n=1 Tax=Subtercola endophyticus TaxID=2895559 RepID=UPI001E603F2F|nr:glycosyltransferase family 2 protein [Subtercola endophyticus]UFS57750.1 glycosyltransferase family 2 protein [Subtercola endophyticus]